MKKINNLEELNIIVERKLARARKLNLNYNADWLIDMHKIIDWADKKKSNIKIRT